MTLTTDIRARIEHADGRQSIFTALGSEEDYQFDKTDLASIHALRRDVNNADVTEDEDEVYLESYDDGTAAYETIFGGILRDVDRSGSKSTLVVASFEQLARDAEPTDGGERWQNVADDTIVTDAIDSVGGLTAGTVETTDSSITFEFSHASPAKKMRTVADATPAFMRYNADKTVDYTTTVGSDKTATTLTPSSQNVSDGFKVNRMGGEERKTHLRMLGVGEGNGQVEANVVASGYSDGERKKWATRINKDIADPDTLEKHGQIIIDELYTDHIEVETTVVNERVELGDEYHLKYDAENVDHNLEAVEVTRVIDSGGVQYETVFASRNQARETQQEKEIKDVDRYNKAFEGTNVTLNTGGGRQPVGPNHNYEFDFYYPAEVTHEHRVKLQVKGLPYRAYSSGVAAGGSPHQHEVAIDTTTTSAQNTEFSGVAYEASSASNVNVPDYFTDVDYVDIPSDITTSATLVTVDLGVQDNPPWDGSTTADDVFRCRVWSGATSHVPDQYGYSARPGATVEQPPYTFSFLIGDDVSGETITIQIEKALGSADVVAETRVQALGPHTHTVDLSDTVTSKEGGGEHSHPPEPGIQEVFGGTRHRPENCDVLVNDTSVGVSMGDGYNNFEETIDLAGMLNSGEFNTVEITSDSLGHIQAAMDCDLFRRVNGNG